MISYKVTKDNREDYTMGKDGILQINRRICVPGIPNLKQHILEEAHEAPYTILPRITTMYHDLKVPYWWSGMMRDIVEFVERCLICQEVKFEHQKPARPFNLTLLFVPSPDLPLHLPLWVSEWRKHSVLQ